MNKLNICFVILGVISSVFAEAPLLSGPYPAPAPVYGPPKIIETPAPYPPAIPAPVYGPPAEFIAPPPQIISNYDYAVYTPKRVEVLAPYAPPAPIIKTAPYAPPAPIIKTAPYAPATPIIEIPRPTVQVISNYHYDLPKYIPAPAPVLPAPVYGPPKVFVAPAPVLPAPVYGPPKIIEPIVPALEYGVPKVIPAPAPVLSTYNYAVHTPQPIVVKTGPYPAPAPLVKIPEAPIVPHTEYGAPVF
ncbi:hypothetical protein PPYR_09357 [Photinus pyralis]|uniref:Uncharacterized protein n=1 Tax=Photinus pyralis TaxID=7054 RepID=A0A5N4AM20_PHOPY|nr:leucine-rich repeat extensin-like protein 3 [Photinus pyralis]XP_031345273.1 leucine-rich repeat extensin-like protein 3 [Photinus pyralis]KAB0798329.1 hypothetical protein PPYR_09322 [Photinus pyralis]KAB0798364.1 hypothetical protein PPYR_09357 [Photinus pyralis]